MTSATFSLQSLQEHLRAHAGDYFPGVPAGEWSITLKSSRRRRYSQIARFTLRSQNASRDLFVKAPRAAPALVREQSGVAKDRPRLLPLLSAREEAAQEFAGMRKLSAHFQAHGDSHLGVSRVLDLYDGESIVIEAVHLPTLDSVIGRAARWRNQAHNAEIAAAFRAAGAWLRVLHALPADQTNRPSLATRDELLQTVNEFADYLVEKTGRGAFLRELCQKLEQSACNQLPFELPLVVGHGDFGMHNLFVTEEGGVLGFDTLAHWQIPSLIDVAYFLLLLETIPPFFASRTWTTPAAVLQICRQEFLRGYCGGTEEPAHLALFELLVALDKWASVVHSCRTARGVLGALKHRRLKLQEHWLQGRICRLSARLDQGRDAQREMPTLMTTGGLP